MSAPPATPTRTALVAAVVASLALGAGAVVVVPRLVEQQQAARDAALTAAVDAQEQAAADARAAEEAAAAARSDAVGAAYARIQAGREATVRAEATTALAGHLPAATTTLAAVEAALAPPEGLTTEQDPADPRVAAALTGTTTQAVAAVALWHAVAAQPLLRPPASSGLEEAVAALPEATQAAAAALTSWAGERETLLAQAAAAREAARSRSAAGAASGSSGSGSSGGPATSGGAAADCGGPDSREAPSSGGVVFYTSTPSVEGDGSNGRIPRSSMTALGWCRDSQGNAQWLRSDAAAALIRLNAAFRDRFGENIAVDLSYRSYETQVAMREHYGSAAARPGTSNHGWGTAFDTWEWAAYAFGSARYEWLVANGPAHGWVAPPWARQGGSNPEYWHFEYVG